MITSFENSLLMRITYTSDAWQEIIERDFEVPRIAFLPWDSGSWAEEWLELGVEEDKIYPPGEDGSDGYLEILIDELPDPLIGDC